MYDQLGIKYMLLQTKAVMSEAISIEITSRSFNFSSFFSLGDEKTTNLSKRLGTFSDSFWDVSNESCKMPKAFCFAEISAENNETIKSVLKVKSDEELWDIRVPIKLVGHLKDLQKTGQSGSLLVDGQPNVFLCRDHESRLQVVQLRFDLSKTWAIHSALYTGVFPFTESSRFFVASR